MCGPVNAGPHTKANLNVTLYVFNYEEEGGVSPAGSTEVANHPMMSPIPLI